jgi:magnesium transporter
MEPDEAEEIRELLAYPPDTAGGIMTPAFVAIAPTLRADQAILALRKVAEEAETINYVYVTDPQEHLLGVLSLHKLVLTRPETPVSELMFTRPITVGATADQEEAAKLLVVIDDEQHLLGIITVDDIAEVLEREATEDIERLGGSAPLTEPYLLAAPSHLFRKRIVWLLVLFMAQFLTVSIIENFESVLEQVTVLSFFMTILIGTGGNVGSQTVSTLIRAIGIGEVSPRHWLIVVWKEFRTGIALGAVMASLMFVRALLIGSGTAEIGLVVATAVFAIVVWAATVGAILPLILTRLRVDPAVVSAPLITSLVDATGLIIYFSVATLILDLA